jgi:hypothetical protein
MICVGKRRLSIDYWIFKVKDEVGGLYGRRGFAIYDHRMRDGFWALREENEKGRLEANISLLKKGDYALFYLVGLGGSRFLGTAILDSGFEQLDAETAKNIVHREYLDWDQGVFLKDINKWVNPLPMEALRGKESFVADGGKISPFFQGAIKKISIQEYYIILREHELVS